MRLYGVFESELDQLSVFNSISLVAFSAGSALAGYAFDWLRGAMGDEAVEGAWHFFWTLTGCSALFFVAGFVLWAKRRSITQSIKDQAADLR